MNTAGKKAGITILNVQNPSANKLLNIIALKNTKTYLKFVFFSTDNCLRWKSLLRGNLILNGEKKIMEHENKTKWLEPFKPIHQCFFLYRSGVITSRPATILSVLQLIYFAYLHVLPNTHKSL